jgi:DNA-binding MarR family transcriptional regulator
LHPVFLAASGVAFVGFLLSWRLPERPLRDAAATSRGLDDGLAAPRSPDSLAEIERALSRSISPERRDEFRRRLAARAGVDLSPGATWALVRIGEHGLVGARELARRDGVPPERVAVVVDELQRHNLIAGEDGIPGLTVAGEELAERAITARRELLSEALADEHADRDPAVEELLHRLARELAGEPPRVAA